MEVLTSDNERNANWWITSLAISVTCCAIMFVIFAGYVADIRKNIAAHDLKIEELIQQQNMLVSQIDVLRHPTTDAMPQLPTEAITPKADVADPLSNVPSLQSLEVPAQQSPVVAPVQILSKP